jgi:hypothetical protein
VVIKVDEGVIDVDLLGCEVGGLINDDFNLLRRMCFRAI